MISQLAPAARTSTSQHQHQHQKMTSLHQHQPAPSQPAPASQGQTTHPTPAGARGPCLRTSGLRNFARAKSAMARESGKYPDCNGKQALEQPLEGSPRKLWPTCALQNSKN
eukprot:gene11865-14971_t